MTKKRIELSGQKFNKLLVVSFAGVKQTPGTKTYLYNCLCDCGKKTVVSSQNVKSGKTKSCGCIGRTVIRRDCKRFCKCGKFALHVCQKNRRESNADSSCVATPSKRKKVDYISSEEWRPIVGYEGQYLVSSLGRVKSIERNSGRAVLRARLMSQTCSKAGYMFVRLCKNNKPASCLVHRLVAQAFLQNPNNLPQVNHLNLNKSDNRPENLEWCTLKENLQHAHANIPTIGNFKLSDDDRRTIQERFMSGEKASAIAKDYGVTRQAIWKNVTNRLKMYNYV